MMWFVPGKRQWSSWSLPSKLTAIGAYLGVAGLFLTLFPVALSWFRTPTIPRPELELKLLQRIDGFNVHVVNRGPVAARQLTVSLKSWQIGAPGPDAMIEFPLRDLAPNDDFIFRIMPIRFTGEREYDRSRGNQPTCGYLAVRSIESLRPGGWAFFIPGHNQVVGDRFYRQDSWPMVEFEYPEESPKGYECVDYPPGICEEVGRTNWIWRPAEQKFAGNALGR